MAAPHPRDKGCIKVPHTDLLDLVSGGTRLRHKLTGEVADLGLSETEVVDSVQVAGDSHRAYVVTNQRKMWANSVLQWSVWQAGPRRFSGVQTRAASGRNAGNPGSSSGTGLSGGLDTTCSTTEDQWFNALSAIVSIPGSHP